MGSPGAQRKPAWHFEGHSAKRTQRADNDTEGEFLHILTLTVGNSVTIRSKANPAFHNTIRKFQSALVPACFGEYELVNEDGSACTVVQLRLAQATTRKERKRMKCLF